MLERSALPAAENTKPTKQSTDPQASDQRASQRWQVLEEAEIITKNGRAPCHVQDISPIGANITAGSALAVAEEVSLILIGFGAVPAEVAWSDGHSAGLKFTYGDDQRGVMSDWLMLIVGM